MSEVNEMIMPKVDLPALEKNVLELRSLKNTFLTGLVRYGSIDRVTASRF